MSNDPKVRYSDEDLLEFKELIEEKIRITQTELSFTQQQIAELSDNGFNKQGGDWYDDTNSHLELEMKQRMAMRQLKFVQDLKNALLRIQNKTYGICTITGQLIDKQRLRAVPHTTKTVDGKNISNQGKEHPVENTGHSDPLGLPTEESKNPTKPIGDKVRIPNMKKDHSSSDEWEPNNDTVEEAKGYSNRKRDDDDE